MYNIPDSAFHEDTYSGYFYMEAKGHEMAMPSGRMFMHRYVMARHLGRKLESWEHVHHIDEDRGNNKIDNLELLTKSEHMKKHTDGWYGESCPVEFICPTCGVSFERVVNTSKQNSTPYCSNKCSTKAQRKFEVSKDELAKLVWEIPSEHIGKLYGVSGRAIGKLCRKLGISKPPRGYWQKLEAKTLASS